MKTKLPTCPICLVEIYGPNTFCPHCGGNQQELEDYFISLQQQEQERLARAEAEKQLAAEKKAAESKTKPVAKPETIQATKTAAKKQKSPVLAIVIVALGAIGVVALSSGSFTSDQATTQPSQADEKTRVDFSEIAGQTITYNAATAECNALGSAIIAPDFLPRKPEVIGSELDKIRSKSAASKYFENNQSWMRESLQVQFEANLRTITDPALRLLITQSGYGGEEFAIDFETWSVSFYEFAIESCDLEDQLAKTTEEIRVFQKDVDRVNTLVG